MADTTEEGGRSPRNWGPAGLLALAPLLAYYLVQSYEVARCAALGIPAALIQVAPAPVFRVGALLLALGALFLYVHIGSDPLFAWLLERLVGGRRVVRLGNAQVGVKRISSIQGPGAALAVTLLAGAGVYLLGNSLDLRTRLGHAALVVLPALVWTGVEWREKLLLDRPAVSRRSRLVCVTVLLAFLANFLMIRLAMWEAKEQAQYAVIPGKPEKVILAWYGNTLVFAPLHRETRQYTPRFQVRQVDQTAGMWFRLEPVGPLTARRAGAGEDPPPTPVEPPAAPPEPSPVPPAGPATPKALLPATPPATAPDRVPGAADRENPAPQPLPSPSWPPKVDTR